MLCMKVLCYIELGKFITVSRLEQEATKTYNNYKKKLAVDSYAAILPMHLFGFVFAFNRDEDNYCDLVG